MYFVFFLNQCGLFIFIYFVCVCGGVEVLSGMQIISGGCFQIFRAGSLSIKKKKVVQLHLTAIGSAEMSLKRRMSFFQFCSGTDLRLELIFLQRQLETSHLNTICIIISHLEVCLFDFAEIQAKYVEVCGNYQTQFVAI